MKFYRIPLLFTIIFVFSIIIFSENVYAEKTIEVEIKYTNGDRADFNSMDILVYQDFNKEPILEKKLVSNPDFISVPENHRYKIEVFANGMYADVGYVELKDSDEKINISIPLSAGLQFEVYYKDGQTPIKDATVVLKSKDNIEWARGTTNDQGETTRFWIQSTTLQDDHYIADVYLEELFLTTYYPIKLLSGSAVDQKIITNIPEIIETLITINLYDASKIITSTNGDYVVALLDLNGNTAMSSKVNFRGDVQFSNIKSGTYTVQITSNDVENNLWPQTQIHIVGDLNKFNIFKNTEKVASEINPLHSCNCISFRLDDVQDYWLSETQIEIINLFSEKQIPLTVGVIGDLIGNDVDIISTINNNIDNPNFEIANHSWNNDVLSDLDEGIQEKFIMDTNDKIHEIFGVKPTSLIPPQNKYDENTIKVLKRNNFKHLISHTDVNSKPSIDDSLYIVPAITETGILVDAIQWKIQDRNHINEKISHSLKQKGYAIVMMHPQEFSLNAQGEYDLPNQEYLSELGLLLDEISQFNAKLVTLNQVLPEGIELENTDESDEGVLKKEDIVHIDSCNCVAFRINDIQDYWLNDVQISIINTFIEKKTPLTIGIIADAFGNDPKITEFVKENSNNDKIELEIATKGIGLTPFTNYEKTQQSNNLKESLDIIESVINIRPHTFIPPDNKFNSDTLEVLEENSISHISASLINGDSPPFEFKDQTVYRFPLTASTGEYNPIKNIYEGLTSEQTILEVMQSMDNYGYAVVSLHLQEFSESNNSTYTNKVNQNQINELKNIIDNFNEKKIKIVTIDKINSNLQVIVPDWIKNNAGWWAEGSIDDKTFVQGIEYLVKEQVIIVDEEAQTSGTEQNIPKWIKNNAGWWAEGSIDDKTFVQGIEYLVKFGIISY